MKKCAEEFHRFLRLQSLEIDPTSGMYEIMRTTFQRGFAEGGEYATKIVAGLIAEGIRGEGAA